MCRTAIAVACKFTLNVCDIHVVNYTKFAPITTVLSGQQLGIENYRVPGYPFRALIVSISAMKQDIINLKMALQATFWMSFQLA